MYVVTMVVEYLYRWCGKGDICNHVKQFGCRFRTELRWFRNMERMKDDWCKESIK